MERVESKNAAGKALIQSRVPTSVIPVQLSLLVVVQYLYRFTEQGSNLGNYLYLTVEHRPFKVQ